MNPLQRLAERGITVRVKGDKLEVKPVSCLDANLCAYIETHKPTLLALASLWSEVETAIIACCDARAESPENRAALLADCWKEPVGDWRWFAKYFRSADARKAH